MFLQDSEPLRFVSQPGKKVKISDFRITSSVEVSAVEESRSISVKSSPRSGFEVKARCFPKNVQSLFRTHVLRFRLQKIKNENEPEGNEGEILSSANIET